MQHVELPPPGTPRHCRVSDLTPLSAMVNLKSLDMSGCKAVSDLAPLEGMVNLMNLTK
jgi:hypothetical protein